MSGFCKAWPIDPSCLPPDWDPTDLTADQEAAIEIASALLKAATGWRYGPCLVTLRPCAPENGMPCTGPCGCAPVCRVYLPGPVTPGNDWGVVGVTVDGTPLPPSAWRVDQFTWLVRQDGTCFPPCQRLDRPAGEEGTWTVTYWRGWPIPPAGRRAVTALAARIYNDCQSNGCWVDPRVTQLTRAGVTYNLEPDSEGTAVWLTTPAVEAWVSSVNPHRLAAPMVVWTPEMGRTHTTTSTGVPLVLSVDPVTIRAGQAVTATADGEAGTVLFDWDDGEATT